MIPGHAALYKYARVVPASTDITILVVAADDGMSTQTIGRCAVPWRVPSIMAVNKIDKPGANLIMRLQVSERELIPLKEWGGDRFSSIFQRNSIKTLMSYWKIFIDC